MSVGIIIHNNHPEYLVPTIESIIKNNYENTNIYILDDKDYLKKVFQECKPHQWESIIYKKTKIHMINIVRKTILSTMLNIGLEQAYKDENKYTTFLTSKEELKDNFLKRNIEYLEQCKAFVGGVYSDFDNLKIPYSYIPIRNFLQSFDRQKLVRGWQIPLSTIVKTEILKKVGVFDTQIQILPEWDLWIRFTELHPIFHLPESLYIHGEILTEQSNSIELIEFTQAYIINKAEQRAKDGK